MLQRRSMFLGIMTAACLFAKVTVDYDHKANFARYHTYSWISVNVQDPGWKDITANAIDAQLTAKGWQEVASGGDASVSAMGATRTEQTLETWYAGGYGGGWFPREGSAFFLSPRPGRRASDARRTADRRGNSSC